MSNGSIRILLADDHGIVRQGLRSVLTRDASFEIVAEAADGREAVSIAESLTPQVVIMDIAMPELNGIEATSQIVKNNPQIRVIILSMHSDETYLLRALNAGAKGYLLKDSADVDLVRAVHSVCRNKPFFSPEIAQVLLEDYVRSLQQKRLQDSYELLTDREKEVLQLLAHGKSNKEVAVALDVSTNTIETHRNSLMKKLNLHNTAEIVLYAVRKKIVTS
jgi:two-component system, NarL family, response regulator NreC